MPNINVVLYVNQPKEGVTMHYSELEYITYNEGLNELESEVGRILINGVNCLIFLSIDS